MKPYDLVQYGSALAALAAAVFWFLSARGLPPARAKVFFNGVGYSPEYIAALLQRDRNNFLAASAACVAAVLQGVGTFMQAHGLS